MDKHKLLTSLRFGDKVAENEGDELINYFVETHQWNQIVRGEVDIVYGPKGSGKSAIYLWLVNKAHFIDGKGDEVFILPAENPRGAPAFKSLKLDEIDEAPDDYSEAKYHRLEKGIQRIWKLYFISMLATKLKDMDIHDEKSRELIRLLSDAKLIPGQKTPLNFLRHVVSFFRAERITPEVGVEFDPTTGAPKFNAKITLEEPTPSQLEAGFVTPEDLFESLEDILKKHRKIVWIVLDRLDVAFHEDIQLEESALRGLFRVYLDIMNFRYIKLKIFLRDDIWTRLTARRFPEASHITRETTLSWNKEKLLNLIIKRFAHNQRFSMRYAIQEDTLMGRYEDQETLFFRIFPSSVEGGQRGLNTLDWMLSRVSDGNEVITPREVINLLIETHNQQLGFFSIGNHIPAQENLFSRQAIKTALSKVSKERLEKTLYAETETEVKYLIEALREHRSIQCLESLTDAWEKFRPEEGEVQKWIDELLSIGFLAAFKQGGILRYRIPYLYRPALDIKQGNA